MWITKKKRYLPSCLSASIAFDEETGVDRNDLFDKGHRDEFEWVMRVNGRRYG